MRQDWEIGYQDAPDAPVIVLERPGFKTEAEVLRIVESWRAASCKPSRRFLYRVLEPCAIAAAENSASAYALESRLVPPLESDTIDWPDLDHPAPVLHAMDTGTSPPRVFPIPLGARGSPPAGNHSAPDSAKDPGRFFLELRGAIPCVARGS